MVWISHRAETTYWDDLKTPASAINPPGQASDPDIDTTTFPGTLLFRAGGVEVVGLVVQLPHSYKEGTDLMPHLHWMKTTSAAGDVLWRIRYKVMRIGAVADAAFTTLESSTPSANVPDNDTANEHVITPLGTIPGTGLGISDMICIELSRVGNDPADTYAADARLLEFDIHYEQDEPGSRQEFRKAYGSA